MDGGYNWNVGPKNSLQWSIYLSTQLIKLIYLQYVTLS